MRGLPDEPAAALAACLELFARCPRLPPQRAWLLSAMPTRQPGRPWARFPLQPLPAHWVIGRFHDWLS